MAFSVLVPLIPVPVYGPVPDTLQFELPPPVDVPLPPLHDHSPFACSIGVPLRLYEYDSEPPSLAVPDRPPSVYDPLEENEPLPLP